MLNQENIEKLLLTMTEDLSSNVVKLKKTFKTINYKDDDNQSLLHILVDNIYNEEKCFLAIKSLLEAGLSPNLIDDFNYIFIQTALYAGYSENFILKIISESLKHNLNINHIDSDKDTIMHTAIYSDDYLDKLINIYNLLHENGLDTRKIDGTGRNLLEATKYQKQAQKDNCDKKIPNLKELELKLELQFNKSLKNQTIISQPKQQIIPLTKDEILKLEKYGKVLNMLKYSTPPTIGREKELKNLIISLAQEKKSTLIVGKSGIGKTAIVDELVYRIITGQVPNFLENRIVLEVNPNDLNAGCGIVGTLEEKIKNLIDLCKKYNIILFIDEIHTIYGAGVSRNNDNDIAAMIKPHLERSNLKIIGTTTEDNYDKYFSNNDLKRRFEKILVKEPTKDILQQIINKIISDLSLKNNLFFEQDEIKNKIINIILNATDQKHRPYNDIVNNPDLSVLIIDKAFAIAKYYNAEYLCEEHFIESFELFDRISSIGKEQAILELRKISKNSSTENGKIKAKIIPFNLTK